MELGLKNKVAIITGAGGGLGRSIASAFSKEGSIVVVTDINPLALDETVKCIEKEGRHVLSIVADISNIDEIDNLAKQVVDTYGQIDIIVNSAGIIGLKSVADSNIEDWNRIISINLTSIFICCKITMEHMKKCGSGRIINIASVSAFKGGGALGNVLYGTSKAGVIAFTKGLARELGSFGITVNAIAPSVAETPMTRGSLDEDVKNSIAQKIPVGRLCRSEDVANACLFLSSDKSEYITGETLVIDGGYLIT